jgi:hypothetical protein
VTQAKRSYPFYGIQYDADRDWFSVPYPRMVGAVATAPGPLVRDLLGNRLPLNGTHLRDTIVAVARDLSA